AMRSDPPAGFAKESAVDQGRIRGVSRTAPLYLGRVRSVARAFPVSCGLGLRASRRRGLPAGVRPRRAPSAPSLGLSGGCSAPAGSGVSCGALRLLLLGAFPRASPPVSVGVRVSVGAWLGAVCRGPLGALSCLLGSLSRLRVLCSGPWAVPPPPGPRFGSRLSSGAWCLSCGWLVLLGALGSVGLLVASVPRRPSCLSAAWLVLSRAPMVFCRVPFGGVGVGAVCSLFSAALLVVVSFGGSLSRALCSRALRVCSRASVLGAALAALVGLLVSLAVPLPRCPVGPYRYQPVLSRISLSGSRFSRSLAAASARFVRTWCLPGLAWYSVAGLGALLGLGCLFRAWLAYPSRALVIAMGFVWYQSGLGISSGLLYQSRAWVFSQGLVSVRAWYQSGLGIRQGLYVSQGLTGIRSWLGIHVMGFGIIPARLPLYAEAALAPSGQRVKLSPASSRPRLLVGLSQARFGIISLRASQPVLAPALQGAFGPSSQGALSRSYPVRPSGHQMRAWYPVTGSLQ
ncbi:hypothetical protein C7M84_020387, partial [Penaeus vannamei]